MVKLIMYSTTLVLVIAGVAVVTLDYLTVDFCRTLAVEPVYGSIVVETGETVTAIVRHEFNPESFENCLENHK